jgi:hypothetical protein
VCLKTKGVTVSYVGNALSRGITVLTSARLFSNSPADSAKAEAIRKVKTATESAVSQKRSDRLLWAHYAAGFDGLAVEIDLPTHNRGNGFYDVIYDDLLPDASAHSNLTIDDQALWFLRRKDREWKYENEIRIIQKGEWYSLCSPVKTVIVGIASTNIS